MGIGHEIAQGMLEMGARVVCASRDKERAEQAARALSKLTGGEARGIKMNVRDESEVDQGFKQVLEFWGRLDVLVNNAGGAPDSKFCHLWERRLADWEYVIGTNLTGVFLCTRAAARVMMPRKAGVIINISSIAGLVGRNRKMYEGLEMRPNLVDYAAAKAGVLGFTRDVAAELAPYGIRVNAISPGGIYRNHDPEFVRRYSEAVALGRMGREGLDLKGAAVFLASDASEYVTGANLVVDGGFIHFK
ncbi:MAG: SDR family oxidoreductase [Candidatus Omnitrophica bacterium]|nr:SDR family oxidoreductase [Candidatus Omnitrophota bacterium]